MGSFDDAVREFGICIEFPPVERKIQGRKAAIPVCAQTTAPPDSSPDVVVALVISLEVLTQTLPVRFQPEHRPPALAVLGQHDRLAVDPEERSQVSGHGPISVTGYGVIAPRSAAGPNLGTMSVYNNVTFQPNSIYQVHLGPTGNSDRISLLGSSSVLNFLTSGTVSAILQLEGVTGFDRTKPAIYTVTTLAAGNSYQLDGLPIPDGTVLGQYTVAGSSFGPIQIDTSLLALQPGDHFTLERSGQNLILAFTPVPEPAMMLGLGAICVAVFRLGSRRRQRERTLLDTPHRPVQA